MIILPCIELDPQSLFVMMILSSNSNQNLNLHDLLVVLFVSIQMSRLSQYPLDIPEDLTIWKGRGKELYRE